ncbi:hypothetical protein SPI_00262 [Niveomyces insectorum RCEF 264]|uniref:chitinase n=1 Tax=Niveomyces insectorum RCEF 264 TaxID=1081102 RepID=A0A167ZZH0_9HYPO|nr:hypothetical protein SPI_00262 [Niveomyces insectorum RCEF 264]
MKSTLLALASCLLAAPAAALPGAPWGSSVVKVAGASTTPNTDGTTSSVQATANTAATGSLASSQATPRPFSNHRYSNTTTGAGGSESGYSSSLYFTNWGIYGANFQPQQIPADKVTRILYAFADIGSDGTVKSSDSYADVEKHYPTDSWNDLGKNAYGCVKQLYLLKKKHRQLKVLLSIGGWTYSPKFPPIAATAAGRQTFAQSAVQLMGDWGFDGIDLDWEYPSNAAQARDFVSLLQACREALDNYADAHAPGYHFLITIASPAGPKNYNAMDLAGMDPYVDAWNLMAYDYAGSWDNTSGHQANIYKDPDNSLATKFSTEQALDDYLDKGIDSSKIMMGLPLYGRSFEATSGLGQPYSGVGAGTVQSGIWLYKDLPRKGAEEAYDSIAHASYSYDKKSRELISYDNVASARKKSSYLMDKRLGGAVYWEASGDRNDSSSLISTVARELASLDRSHNLLKYPASQYDNIRTGVPDVSWNRSGQRGRVLPKPESIPSHDRGIGPAIRPESSHHNNGDSSAMPADTTAGDGGSNEQSEPQESDDFGKEYENAGGNPSAGNLYGGTLSAFDPSEPKKFDKDNGVLTEWTAAASIHSRRPFKMNPYPAYNSRAWRAARHARYEPCTGPGERPLPDIAAFPGRPKNFPPPSFGSYEVFGLDPSLCFERDTRLGVYALPLETRDAVDWGALQTACVARNVARFNLTGPANDFLTTAYGPINDGNDDDSSDTDTNAQKKRSKPQPRHWWKRTDTPLPRAGGRVFPRRGPDVVREPRTAILLRSYTGKEYTENDRYIIRSLVSELALRSGGEYQVFLLVHVKEPGVDLLADRRAYEAQRRAAVPPEFRGMTLLWNDAAVRDRYPRLARGHHGAATDVHSAQWLPVQAFAQEFREFAHVWNWEMDTRLTGHAYDMLEKLAAFAKRQPRKGLWERNERYYIPGYYGAYDTAFRASVDAAAAAAGHDAVWGAPRLPFIHPVGPSPPLPAGPGYDDDYQWGTDEEADLITLAPLFDPRDSGWILGNDVWAYSDENHTSGSLPRRGSIGTQCRLSRALLDIMHVESLRGNHAASEMVPGTVSLLHGLKAVFAPIPVFMDRPISPARLARWFNSGPRGGSSGGPDSAMGWGREDRFRGATWYYRAGPPQRLYNNWVGYEDNGVGGLEWELARGRPCLPAMFLHPVKDVLPTGPGYRSESNLPY